MTFNKSDIPALDFIIDRLLENDFPLYSDDLTKEGLISGDNHRDTESKFENLLAIIKQYGCASVTDARNEDHGASVERNGFTSKFKRDGGFNKAFNDLQNEIVRKDKVFQKEQLDSDVLKLQKENFEYLKTIRDKEEIIRNLEIRLKRIELIKQYRWFIGFILTACIILGGLLDRLIQMLWPS